MRKRRRERRVSAWGSVPEAVGATRGTRGAHVERPVHAVFVTLEVSQLDMFALKVLNDKKR